MACKEPSKKFLTQGNSDSESTHLGRRGFLTVSGIAALSTTGQFVESVAAATTPTGGYGYGIESYGTAGYGGIEPTE